MQETYLSDLIRDKLCAKNMQLALTFDEDENWYYSIKRVLTDGYWT